MKQLKTLVAMQLRDKIDFSWLKEKKQVIRKVVLSLVKFIGITGILYFIFRFSLKFIFFNDETPQIIAIIFTLALSLSLISCTVELMKNLYFSEDNRVLITLPVNSNKIFVSKIVVYYVYELKKSFNFLIPITLSCAMVMVTTHLASSWILVWMWLPMLFIIGLPVLFGALLSIPAMFLTRLLKKNALVELIVFLGVLAGVITGVVFLIRLIPDNIDLINQWPSIKKGIQSFLLFVETKLFLISQLVRIIIGELQPDLSYGLRWITLGKFAILIATCVVLIVLVYFISRPIFFKMMAKNFEINKSNNLSGKNKRHSKYVTFIDKEFKINLRTIEISVNYLMVYIIVPILILFLNAIYKVIDTRELGKWLIYAFNILLICLPLLASNALVATYYSREGRAAYIKKTKPIHATYPLFVKLFFNVIFSIPTVFVTTGIFGNSVGLDFLDSTLLGFAILLLHLGHMIYSAMLDVMNPQNEQYATLGLEIDNPNENKSTVLAFVLSFIYAIISYKLLSEASTFNNDLTIGFLKLFFIGLAIFVSTTLLFVKRIKAYYYEIQG